MHKKLSEIKINIRRRGSLKRFSIKIVLRKTAGLKTYSGFVQRTCILWNKKAGEMSFHFLIFFLLFFFLNLRTCGFNFFGGCMFMSVFWNDCGLLCISIIRKRKHRPQLENHLWITCSFIFSLFCFVMCWHILITWVDLKMMS